MDDEERRKLREEIMKELDERQQVTDEELYDIIDRRILEYGQISFLPLKDKKELRGRLFDSFRRLGVLQELVDDEDVTEIMVNGADHVFVEKNGRMEQWVRAFDSQEQLEDTIQQIVSRVNRTVNVSRPIADARLSDGSRVHVVLPPIALDGPAVTIRKFPKPITMTRLLKLGSVTEEAADFLKCIVGAGYNIFISGGTNSGKSTFLNALSAYIPGDERIVTIEDSAELKIAHIPNLVRLETREANGEGDGEVSIGDLIRAALRMNPSRIIVGEVRGKEALDMISAMNTGHDGSLSTGHGNSPRDMLSRLETMVLMGADIPLAAARSQVAAAIDILIHLGRLRDKSRRVLSIVEVIGYENGEIRLNPLYRFEEDYGNLEEGQVVHGSLKKVGIIQNAEKLKAAGIEI
ncbi:type II secretion system protein E [Lacrimispora sphenoides]|uniref:Pilus assembly protein CpaF n=2 Tax=Lacrimispora sphenoides TaxID=29370 RepID=A0ABY1CHK8_9FIRM|nr:CpaF family protein [Lacrimispora sphenoides]SEU02945.1 pilus assembly protein CpaF [[Clostridium] sphenoides JCM 1415]SUY48731.1 type II secretion system protein E [Lacrimispora sphenoides]